MGRAKEMMEENAFNDEIIELLKEQLRCDELKGATEGIARFAIDNGIDNLSPKQTMVIDAVVERFKKEHVCEGCDNDNVTQMCDYIYLKDSSLCPTCEYDKSKYMKD